MPTTNKPIRFPAATATIQGKAEPGEIPKSRRFHATVYTGGQLEVGGYGLPIVIDLAGMDERNSLKANLDHDPEKRVGHVDVCRNDGRSLRLSGLVSATGPAAQEFVGNADAGYPWSASIEATPSQLDEISKGEKINANGRHFDGPVYVAKKSSLSGFAFVSSGADDHTQVELAASRRGKPKMSFEQFSTEMGFDPKTTDRPTLASIHANYEGREVATDADYQAIAPLISASAKPVVAGEVDDIKAIVDAVEFQDESMRPRLQAIAAQAVLGNISIAELNQQVASLQANDAALAKLRADRPQGHTVHSHNLRDDNAVLEAAFLSHLGHESIAEKTLGAQATQQARDLGCNSFYDIIKAGLQMTGADVPRGKNEMIKAGFSTYSLATTLGAAANKLLQDAYNAFPSTARLVARKLSAKDFKTHTGLRMTANSLFEQVGPAGEIKHGDLSEATFTYSVNTYARMFGITRTDIINDDLGAFSTLPGQIGRGAAEAVDDNFWTLVLANTGSFFAGGNNNYISGATTNLSAAGLNAGVTAMLQMVDANGRPISVLPKYVLVPPELKVVADELYVSRTLNVEAASAGTDPRIAGENVNFGKYQPVCSPYLSNSSYSGYSVLVWYLVSDPNDVAAFGLAYLNGVESPTVETAQADFNTLGIQYRGYLDFGSCQIDTRGWVMSKGEA